MDEEEFHEAYYGSSTVSEITLNEFYRNAAWLAVIFIGFEILFLHGALMASLAFLFLSCPFGPLEEGDERVTVSTMKFVAILVFFVIAASCGMLRPVV